MARDEIRQKLTILPLSSFLEVWQRASSPGGGGEFILCPFLSPSQKSTIFLHFYNTHWTQISKTNLCLKENASHVYAHVQPKSGKFLSSAPPFFWHYWPITRFSPMKDPSHCLKSFLLKNLTPFSTSINIKPPSGSIFRQSRIFIFCFSAVDLQKAKLGIVLAVKCKINSKFYWPLWLYTMTGYVCANRSVCTSSTDNLLGEWSSICPPCPMTLYTWERNFSK